MDAAEAMIRFTMVMNKSNNLHFKKTKPITEKHGEQSRPWWDKECNRPVKKHPKSALRRNISFQQKRKPERHSSPTSVPKTNRGFISFVKCMAGKGTNISTDGTAINTNGGIISSPKEKTDVFLHQFGSASPKTRKTGRRPYVVSAIPLLASAKQWND